jgi:uncharacterized protein (TIGR00661 family)
LRLPIIAIDNQHLLTDTEITYPREYRKEAAAAKIVTRLMTPRADAYLVTTFFTPRVKKQHTFLFPPILREAIIRARPTEKEHVIVYVTSPAQELADLLRTVRQRFICYGFNRDGEMGTSPIANHPSTGFRGSLYVPCSHRQRWFLPHQRSPAPGQALSRM